MRRSLLLLALPLALAACGGSSSPSTSSSTTTASSAGAAFVQAGNQVCIDSDKRIQKIGRLSRDPKGWARTAAAARQAMREMRAVTPPAGRATGFQLLLRYGNALTLTIQEIEQSLKKKDIDTAAAAQFAAAQLQDKVHQTAKSIGLTFCQQQFTNWPA